MVALLVALMAPAQAETSGASEDREAQPIKPPRPVYPIDAARVGMPGICEVKFDVDTRGYTTRIDAYCTHRAFCQSATDAVAGVKFEPKLVGGLPSPRYNVVYPLEYNIGGTQADRQMRMARILDVEPVLCPSDRVS